MNWIIASYAIYMTHILAKCRRLIMHYLVCEIDNIAFFFLSCLYRLNGTSRLNKYNLYNIQRLISNIKEITMKKLLRIKFRNTVGFLYNALCSKREYQSCFIILPPSSPSPTVVRLRLSFHDQLWNIGLLVASRRLKKLE